jgi:hypothetical protein
MIRGGVSNVLGKSRKGNLSEKFFMPPFTALLARDGAWQQRKNLWLALGMKSEAGRMEAKKTCLPSGIIGGNVGDIEISIFDPVLAEIAYRWFCPAGGQVVDPFSGGSVRGIVASVLGYKYWGCDLSAEQVEANKRQGEALCDPPMPEWVRGDSREMLAGAPEADFIFSCPPYGDLEVYSHDPADLSNMSHSDFLRAYADVAEAAAAKLKNNRFACFVVGDYRDDDGFYRSLPAKTVKVFEMAGLRYYNEAILITVVGSAFLRTHRPFVASRKLAKMHQNVLVFVKGDPKVAAAEIEEAGTVARSVSGLGVMRFLKAGEQ